MRRSVGGRLLFSPMTYVSLSAADDYKLGPDSERHDGVPDGKVTQHKWNSNVFPGTEREYWVYVPAQYDAKEPACVMVFQDGGGYQVRRGSSACRSCSTI